MCQWFSNMFSTSGRNNNKNKNDDDVDFPGKFAGSARFAFAKMSINTRWTNSVDIDIYFYIFYFSHPMGPTSLSYLVSFHMSQARWQNFMRIGFTFWNSFIKSKTPGAGHPHHTTHSPIQPAIPPNPISFPEVPANASDFHLTLMMFIYFGENGKYTKYTCIYNMCTGKISKQLSRI